MLNVGVFIFAIAQGSHPITISNVFRKSQSFLRNLDFIKPNVAFTYLHKQVPYSLINSWNGLNKSYRGWLNKLPNVKNYKRNSSSIEQHGLTIFKYRLNGFKKAFIQTTIALYKDHIACSNSFCLDCSS